MDENIVIKIGADIKELSNKLSESQKALNQMGKMGEEAGTRGAIGIGKILTALGLVAAATKVFGMIKDSIGSAFSRIDTMEQFERVMTVMTGSSEKANSVLKTINDTVKGTAYGLDVAAKATQDFVTSNMDVDKATESVAAWGDAVAFYGDGSNATFASVSDALAKATAKGKVQMDTMNRLAEAGIPAMQIYADATGQSVEQVADSMQKGELRADKFMDIMNDAMMNGTKNFDAIGGAAKDAGASWGASFDNMRAAVTRGVVNIIKKIDEMLTSNGLPDMREMVAEFGRKFEEALNKVADYVPTVVNALSSLLDSVKKVYESIKPWLPLIGALAVGFASYVTIMKGVTAAQRAWDAVQKVSIVLTKAQRAAHLAMVTSGGGVKGVLLAIRAAMSQLNKTMLLNPWVLAAAAAVAAVILIYKYWEPISKFFIELWGVIKESGLAIWEALKTAWANTVAWFKDVWASITTFFSGLWKAVVIIANSVWDSVKQGWQSTVQFFVNIWESVTGFFKEVWNQVVTTAINIWDDVVAKWNATVSFATSIFSPMIAFFADAWSSIHETAMTVWGNISSFLSTLWSNIQVIASSAWEIIKNVILGPILLLINLVTGDMEEFKTNLSAIWGNISDAAGRIWGAIKDIVSSYVYMLVENAKSMWEGFKNTIVGFWEAIKETAGNIWNVTVNFILEKLATLEESFDLAMEWIMGVLVNAWTFIDNLWRTALSLILGDSINNFEEIKHSIEDAMEAVWVIIETVWTLISETFHNVIGIIKALVDGDFQEIKNIIDSQMTLAKEALRVIWDNVKIIFNKVLSAIWGIVKEKFAQIKQWAIDKTNEAKTGLSQAWEDAKTAVRQKITDMWEDVKQKFDDIKTAVKDKMNEAKTTISDIWDEVVTFFKEIDLLQIGKDVIQGFINGIKSKVEDVASAAKDAADAVTGKIKSILRIKSPSRLLMALGRNTGEGLAIGLANMRGDVEKSAQQLADAAVVEPSLGFNADGRVHSSMASALNGSVDVNQRDSALVGAIASLERKLTDLRVEMDGQAVGNIVTGTVSENINRESAQTTRGRGRRRL